MSDQFEVLASVYRGLVDMLIEDGHDPADVTRGLDIHFENIETPQERFAIDQITALWELAYKSRGPTIGVQAAQRIKLRDFQDIGIFLGATENIADLMAQIDHYSSLFTNVSKLETELTKQGLEVRVYYNANVPLLLERLEFIALMIPVLVSQYLTSPLKLAATELTRPKPDDTTPWDEAFGVAVKWNAPVTKYVIGYEEANRLIISRNAQMRKGLEVLLDSRLEATKKASPLTEIRTEMLKQLSGAAPSVDSIASALHRSTRSLQRQLKQADSSFSQLLSDVREDMAKHYLTIGLPVAKVANLLGYSDTSIFGRAFKRWMGMTPNEYLDSLKSND